MPVRARSWRASLAAGLRRVGLALAVGYILMFYAERVFWAHWRHDDALGSILATWIAYAIGAEICLVVIRDFRVRSAWALFLVGALLGWLIEGVFMMTFFGAGGIPFPLTVAWTALSWHALIDVVIGWYALQLALLHSFRRTALICIALGIFWGVWSIFWDLETPAEPIEVFVLHAFLTTFLLILAYRALPVLQVGRIRPSWIERGCLAAFVLLFFGGVTVVQFSWLALITLPPLFALIFWALRHNARVESEPDFLTVIDQDVPWSRALALLLMPALACLIYVGCRVAEFSAQTNLLVYFVTLPLGTIAFIVSVWKVLRRRPDGASFAHR